LIISKNPAETEINYLKSTKTGRA